MAAIVVVSFSGIFVFAYDTNENFSTTYHKLPISLELSDTILLLAYRSRVKIIVIFLFISSEIIYLFYFISKISVTHCISDAVTNQTNILRISVDPISLSENFTQLLGAFFDGRCTHCVRAHFIGGPTIY